MKKKTFQRICGVISFMGFMLVLGTVGAMENNNIAFTQSIIHSAIGLVMFGGGAYAGGYMK
ncbi:MAG: hypothetical protein K0R50_430 [Eubacterium sp.]|jgi:predicted Na+-dependent transporter|nr:hypothetical protein [Eubacterium sp.]